MTEVMMTEVMMTEETIDILYNTCFGGWRPSEKAIALYNARMKEIDAAFSPITGMEMSWYAQDRLKYRHDPILVKIYYELGHDFDEPRNPAKTSVQTIPAKYKNYYSIVDYDGNEDIEIDMTTYEFNEFKEKIAALLKNSSSTDGEKIKYIQELLEE